MDGFLDGAKRLLSSPAAGGLLSAAAVGVNPALGLLAIPGLSSMVREGQETRERNRTAAEQELEARSLEIAAARRRENALSSLPGLLSPNLDAGPPRSAAQTQAGLLTALTNIAPQAATQGLLAQAFPQAPRVPARLQEFAAYQQMTPEQRALYDQFGNRQGNGEQLDAILKALQIDSLIGERDDRTRARAAEAEAEETAEAVEAATSEGLAAEARNVFEQMSELEGTLLEPGSSDMFSEIVRAGQGVLATGASAAGLPVGSALRANNAARDEFGKALARLRNAAVDEIVPEGATNQKREEAAQGFPTPNMEPAAIRSGIREFAENRIRTLRAQGASDAAIRPFMDLLEIADSGVTVEFD